MSERAKDATKAAQELVEANGWKARQLIADKVAEAIREGDMTSAKQWDAIWREVDLALGQRNDPTTIEGARSACPPLSD